MAVNLDGPRARRAPRRWCLVAASLAGGGLLLGPGGCSSQMRPLSDDAAVSDSEQPNDRIIPPVDSGFEPRDATAPGNILLLPDATGWVDRAVTESTHVQGQWYGYSDGIGQDGMVASGVCEHAGHPAPSCSQLTMPPIGIFPNTAGTMCTSGVAAPVVALPDAGTVPDYQNITGGGIALALNQQGAATMPYDALANGVSGFAFDIDVIPLGGIRVGFPVPSMPDDPAFWGGDFNMVSPVHVGHNEIRWADVRGPFYLAVPPAFDPRMILSIQFHVPSNASADIPYGFCVSNLVALTQ